MQIRLVELRVVLLGLALLAAAAGPARAQVITVQGGTISARGLEHQRSHSFAVEYAAPVTGRLGLGVLYLNEGHFESHHRDGFAVQLWGRSPPLWHGLTFSLGVGPYLYFDTAASPRIDYANVHGGGIVYSAGASIPVAGRWSAEARLNRVQARSRFDTNVALLGIGYRLGPAQPQSATHATTAANEITASAGRAIVNSFGSETAVAASIEYRRTAGRFVQWTLAWLDEGDADRVRRQGAAAQAWLYRDAFDDKLQLGVGAGIYLAWDRRVPGRGGEYTRRVANLFSMTAAYRVTPKWRVRATWHRVDSDYHRDADILLVGAGYSF